MKHFYNLSSAATTLQSPTSALGTALSSKIISLLFFCFFLLVSGESMGQTLYTNGFNDANGIATQNITRGSIGVVNGLLEAATVNGNNNGYDGYIAITPAKFTLIGGYTYTITFQARANNQQGAATGTVQVRYGSTAATAGSSQGTLVGSATIAKSAQYATYSITFSLPNTVAQQFIALQLSSIEANNTHMYIDNLSFIQSCAPAAPQATSASTCSSPASLTLTASGAAADETYRWYKLEGGNYILLQNDSNPTFVTDELTSSATYYVSRYRNAACESPKVAVEAIVGAAKGPTVNSTENCPTGDVILVASGASTGDTYKWYKQTSETTSTDVTLEAVRDETNNTSRLTRKRSNQYGTYYAVIVKSNEAGGCESLKTFVNIMQQGQNIQAPSIVSTPVSRCGVGPVTLTATGALDGEDYLWYTSPTGGTAVHRGAIYITNPLPNNPSEFYVSKINNALGCESATRTLATAIVNTPETVTGDIAPIGQVSANESATFTVTSNIVADGNAAAFFWYIKRSGETYEYIETTATNTYTINNVPSDLREVMVEILIGENGCYGTSEEPFGAGSFYPFTSETITPLPVELISFSAQRHTQGVSLSWVTASELDNKGFEVQVSTDSRNFTAIGFVESKVGTTILKQYYNFLDTKAVSGTRYYRLKQIDFDGKSAFSNIKAVSLNGNNGVIAAYPNPFDNVVIVTLNGTEARNVHVILTNSMGKVIQESIEETSGNSISVNMAGVTAKGMYMLHVMDNGSKHVFKLMKR